jgi:hypothetical protein
MGADYDVLLTATGPVLGKNARRCPGCGLIYVLRDRLNECPVCKVELPIESPEG